MEGKKVRKTLYILFTSIDFILCIQWLLVAFSHCPHPHIRLNVGVYEVSDREEQEFFLLSHENCFFQIGSMHVHRTYFAYRKLGRSGGGKIQVQLNAAFNDDRCV